MSENKCGYQTFGKVIEGLALPDFATSVKWRGSGLQSMRNTILGPAITVREDYERLSFDIGEGQSLKAAYQAPLEAGEGPMSRPVSRPVIILIHGMTGSEESANIISPAAYFNSLGYPVLRLNLRGAGPSAKSCHKPYHGGLTEDLVRIIDQVTQKRLGNGIVLYAVSLGGNMMLKYLGEAGHHAPVRAAIGISAPLNLQEVQQCIMKKRNSLYHNYLLLGLKRSVKGLVGSCPEELMEQARSAKSIFEFDDKFTAPANGMKDAAEYYRLNSCEQYIDRITVPTLLVHALNDPWIPAEIYQNRDWPEKGPISLILTGDGGHAGFHAKDDKIPWHERVAARYLDHVLS